MYRALPPCTVLPETTIRTLELNDLQDRMTVIKADAMEASRIIGSCSVDAVICNPPYGHPSASLISPTETKATARSQNEHTLNHFLKGAFKILKGKGRLILVYPAAQMLFLMKRLQENHLEPKRFQLVYPHEDKPANLVLLEAVKDAKPTLHPMPPLMVYNADGSLTNVVKSIYHM